MNESSASASPFPCDPLARKYTKKQLDILLTMRREPRTREYIQKSCKLSKDSMNMNLSMLSELYYEVEDRNVWKGTLKLNEIGETIAQAEHDRRFDMYYTRALAFLSMATSIAAVVITAIRGTG